MNTRLILIRHGASHHKEAGIVGGHKGCRGLTDAGRLQAERLARHLGYERSGSPAAIYSSVLRRAVETAEIIASAWDNLTVTQDCDLCTWHTPPEADGKPWSDYQRENTLAGGGVFRPFEKSNESWGELVIRIGRTLEEIVARHVGQTVLIITHAEPIEASFIVFGGLPLFLSFDMKVANASITEWLTEGDPDAFPRPRWTLARFNDAAYLSSENPILPKLDPVPPNVIP